MKAALAALLVFCIAAVGVVFAARANLGPARRLFVAGTSLDVDGSCTEDPTLLGRWLWPLWDAPRAPTGLAPDAGLTGP